MEAPTEPPADSRAPADSRTERPAAPPEDIDYVASSGSCARCGRALNLASAKVDGCWYGSPLCATDAPCPLDRETAVVAERRLYSRPRRYLRRRVPKELNARGPR